MKNCELCKSPARTYCESDDASLCWSCDANVHGANFLVARHSRTLLCQLCQSVTPWQAAGAKLGNAFSFCLRCANGDTTTRDESGSEEEEDEDDEIEEDQEEEEGDNQVVPWSSSSASTPPPPPPASDSEDCEDFVESDQRSLDLRFFPQDDISRRSSCSRQSAINCDDDDDSSRPLKIRRREGVDEHVTSRESGRPI